MATSITKKPTSKVSLSVSRDGSTFKATWKVPSDAKRNTGTGSEARFQHVQAELLIGKKERVAYKTTGIGLSTNSITSKMGTSKNVFNRSSYWPLTDTKLSQVAFRVCGQNSEGNGPTVTKAMKFSKPAKPTLGSVTVDNDGLVKCTAKLPDASKSKAERYRMAWRVNRTVYQKGKSAGTGHTKWAYVNGQGSVTKDLTYNDASMRSLDKGDYVVWQFEAVSQGLAGSSEHVTRSLTFGWPADPAVSKALADRSRDTLRVGYEMDTKTRPVSEAVLQCAKTAAASPGNIQDADWKAVATGDGNDRWLSCTVSEIDPQPGEHVFVRVVTRGVVDGMEGKSEPFEVSSVYAASADSQTAPQSQVKVESASPCADGKSISVVVGWAPDAYDCTEVSWDTDPDAWRSTRQPESWQMPDAAWADDVAASSLGRSATVKLTGLDEATTYHVRARRAMADADGKRTGWSESASATTGTVPVGVTASAPSRVARGDSYRVSWILGGGRAQAAWSVALSDGSGKTERLDGTGSDSSCEVPRSFVDGCDGAVTAVVSASTDGTNFTPAYPVTTVVADRPSAVVECAEAIASLPHAFRCKADVGTSLACRLVSMGTVQQLPDGQYEQFEGDVVWSADYVLEEPGGDGFQEFQAGAGARLVDGALYRLEVTPSRDGLTGDTACPTAKGTEEDEDGAVVEDGEGNPVDFDHDVLLLVDWAHKADADTAPCSVAADPDSMSADVTVGAPTGYADGDVFDLYRKTPDGCEAIAVGVAFGTTVSDRWAPYGTRGVENAYRVAVRTKSGDVEWQDVPYEMHSPLLRFDWGDGRSVGLLWNMGLSDTYRKQFTRRSYLDGTTSGGWDGAATRDGTYTTNMAKVGDAETERLVREMARHQGPVFVRTPYGAAFEADVQLGSVVTNGASCMVACSFSVSAYDCRTYVCDVEGAGL